MTTTMGPGIRLDPTPTLAMKALAVKGAIVALALPRPRTASHN